MKRMYVILAICTLIGWVAYAWAMRTFTPWWAGSAVAGVIALVLAIIQPLFKSDKTGWLLASGVLNLVAGIALQIVFIPLLLKWPLIGFLFWAGAWLYAANWLFSRAYDGAVHAAGYLFIEGYRHDDEALEEIAAKRASQQRFFRILLLHAIITAIGMFLLPALIR